MDVLVMITVNSYCVVCIYIYIYYIKNIPSVIHGSTHLIFTSPREILLLSPFEDQETEAQNG